jgi:hypothetical protein
VYKYKNLIPTNKNKNTAEQHVENAADTARQTVQYGAAAELDQNMRQRQQVDRE